MTALKAKKRAEELETKGQAMNAYDRTLLLGGSTNGMIVVFDWQNDTNPGKISFQIEVSFFETKATSVHRGVLFYRPKLDSFRSKFLRLYRLKRSSNSCLCARLNVSHL